MMTNESEVPLLIRLVYAGSHAVDFENTYLQEEGHALLALTPYGNVRFGACSCPRCQEHQLDIEDVTPDQFIRWVLEELRPESVRLVVQPDMGLPLYDGTMSSALQLAAEFQRFLQGRGVDVLLTDRLVDNPLQEGDWVRFCGDYLVNESYCIEAGMFGQVLADPHQICTPGVTAIVRAIGLDVIYGYPCEIMKKIPAPDPTQLKRARERAENAFVGYQERHGWHGIVGQGKSQRRMLLELRSLPRAAARETKEKALRGIMKRMARVLAMFEISPWGHEAATLAARCHEERDSETPTSELLLAVERFCDSLEDSGGLRKKKFRGF